MSEASSQQPAKKKNRSGLVILIVFIAFVAIVFWNNQRQEELKWNTDHAKAVSMAKEQNKPLLITMYKDYFHKFTRPMMEETYADPKIVAFVHENYIPLLIDVNKQPKIGKLYSYGYDPTNLIIDAKTGKRLKTVLGHEAAGTYLEILRDTLEKYNLAQ